MRFVIGGSKTDQGEGRGDTGLSTSFGSRQHSVTHASLQSFCNVPEFIPFVKERFPDGFPVMFRAADLNELVREWNQSRRLPSIRPVSGDEFSRMFPTFLDAYQRGGAEELSKIPSRHEFHLPEQHAEFRAWVSTKRAEQSLLGDEVRKIFDDNIISRGELRFLTEKFNELHRKRTEHLVKLPELDQYLEYARALGGKGFDIPADRLFGA